MGLRTWFQALSARDAVFGAVIGAVAVVVAALIPLFSRTPPTTVTPPQNLTVVIPANVVPPPKNVSVVPTLKEAEGDAFRLLRDISIFDLRAWKAVPAPLLKTQRVSPVSYINYLHIKKIRQADTFIAHYSTSGVAIDLRCITHNARIFQKEMRSHAGNRSYSLEVDVKAVPLNHEFMIVIEGTYWNSFQNIAKESAGTYIDPDGATLEELALIVLFPESKPFKDYQRMTGEDGADDVPYRGEDSFYADIGRRFIYWSIKERQVGRHYTVEWTW